MPSFSSSFFREGDDDSLGSETNLHLANLYLEEMSQFLQITPTVEDVEIVIQSCIPDLERPLDSLESSELTTWGEAGREAATQVLARRGLRIFVPLHISFLASCGSINLRA